MRSGDNGAMDKQQENTMETIGSYLEADHVRCDALFASARHAVRKGLWREAGHAFATFCHALERHLLMEERIVFPAFENAIGAASAPTASMRSEHLRIRGVVQRLSNALRERDTEAFLDHADTLGIVLYQHSEKEEGVLYPMIERVLAPSCHKLVAAMQAFGAMDDMASAA
ncbi:hemerythrin HHE cation-binding protein [Massilia violaceinigra]|uniref:Hemerythrin HHE cation-binding protein n=1 Tax=Massilia violaceinigra TaxID=2045208 RepID=A0A2D2DPU3_9BURK|nr:hemerythrin domain-containing protein [Massilia violaceinigra]ATQ76980.1 hemerythrin HHE cation-binding protein [Massilia violaceinigra]